MRRFVLVFVLMLMLMSVASFATNYSGYSNAELERAFLLSCLSNPSGISNAELYRQVYLESLMTGGPISQTVTSVKPENNELDLTGAFARIKNELYDGVNEAIIFVPEGTYTVGAAGGNIVDTAGNLTIVALGPVTFTGDITGNGKVWLQGPITWSGTVGAHSGSITGTTQFVSTYFGANVSVVQSGQHTSSAVTALTANNYGVSSPAAVVYAPGAVVDHTVTPGIQVMPLGALANMGRVPQYGISVTSRPTSFSMTDNGGAGITQGYTLGSSDGYSTLVQFPPVYDCTDLRLVYTNEGDNGAPNPNTITVKAAIWYGPLRVKVTFNNGAPSVTITGGSVVISDPVPIQVKAINATLSAPDMSTAAAAASVLTSLTPPLQVLTYVTGASGTKVPGLQASTGSTSGLPAYNVTTGNVTFAVQDADDAADYTTIVYPNGAPTDGSPDANWYLQYTSSREGGPRSYAKYTCHSVLGWPTDGVRRPCVAIIGDSICSRWIDRYWPQALFHGAFQGQVPVLQWTTNGASALSFLQGSSAAYFNVRGMLEGCTHCICEYGRNDIGGTSSSDRNPVYRTEKILLNLWSYAAGLGMKVYQTTITPYTTDSTNTTLTANQETNRTLLNTWLRDTSASGAKAQSNGALYGVLDIAAKVEATSGGVPTGFWASASYTADGIHPSIAGCTQMNTAVSASLFTQP